jgi:glucose/arabinose dehydrogenase/plastocyanin
MLNRKIAVAIAASIFFIAFVISSVSVYMNTGANLKQVNETTTGIVNGNGNGTKFYGCEKFELTKEVHCDPSMNSFVAYIMPTNSSTIYTAAGTPMFVAGKHGLGLLLDAPKREGVEFANTSKLGLANFSISLWLKNAKEPRPYSSLISHYDRDTGRGWTVDTFGSGISPSQFVTFSIFNEKGHRFSSSAAPISSNSFVHIVGTFNGSTIKIYENGILFGSTGFQGKFLDQPRLPLTIGTSSFCLTCNLWSGIVDDVRLYNRTINENEVKEIFVNDSPGTVSHGLVGHWTFENTLNDISANKHNGNLDSLIANMAFAPDGRLFFDEKNTGKIRIMKDDKVLPTPFATVSDYYVNWEQGLLGLAVDPKFEQNHFVYLYYTALNNNTGQGEPFNKLVRFTENNNVATNMLVLLDKIPASRGYHSGGALAFGPDDKLYIGIGDATQHEFAQDGGVVTGKVLRINRDGTIPQDNPFANSPVYTIGHRNIFGIAFDRKDGIGIISENGDFHYDEINIIQKGGNYGFPAFQPSNIAPELFTNNSSIKPIRSYWQTVAPTQTIYYDGDKLPHVKNKFLFGTFSGNMYALTIDRHSKQLILEEKLALRHYPIEPAIAIAQSPSGDIYYGGYHIYKLKSIDVNSKIQDLFPIEIKSSSNLAINDLRSSGSSGGLAIDIHPSMNTNGSSTSAPASVQINIPNALIPRVFSVTNTITNEGSQPSTMPIDFSITNSSSIYNTINVRLPSGTHYSQLLINGISPNQNVQNTTTPKSDIYNISSVSIVKFASDSSTAMPYDPSPLTIARGTSVKWTNNDFTPHTVTEVTNKFDSGTLAPGQKFKLTFAESGIITYYCTIHPFMKGEVIVR